MMPWDTLHTDIAELISTHGAKVVQVSKKNFNRLRFRTRTKEHVLQTEGLPVTSEGLQLGPRLIPLDDVHVEQRGTTEDIGTADIEMEQLLTGIESHCAVPSGNYLKRNGQQSTACERPDDFWFPVDLDIDDNGTIDLGNTEEEGEKRK